MAADGSLMNIPVSSANQQQKSADFDTIESLFMSTTEWQLPNDNTDQLLSGLLNGVDSTAFLSDLLEPPNTSPDDGGSGFNNYSPPAADWMNNTSPSTTTSDEGSSSMYNPLSPSSVYFSGNTSYSPGTTSGGGGLPVHHQLAAVDNTLLQSTAATTNQDVHINVAELDDEYPSSTSDRKTGSMVISEEERDLLSREGINIPVGLPLTKSEEKHVKRIRRKIKNKQSAADSRKRKKEYVDGLERRVEKCTEMNNSLMKKVKSLENENKSLVEQLKRLQAFVSQYNPSKLQAGSFMMVVILSFSLLIVPQVYKPALISRRSSSFSHARSLLDISSDEFGNMLQNSENGFIGVSKDKSTPLLPLPWQYQSPALKPWNISSSDKKDSL